MIRRIPYNNIYPSALRDLIESGLLGVPRQSERSTDVTSGVDINYILKREGRYGWSINDLEENLEGLALAIYQDLKRFEEEYPGILFWGRIIYSRSGKKIEAGIHTTNEAEKFVWGPEYDVPQYDLVKHLNTILNLKKKYPKEKFEVKRVFVRPNERIRG